MNVEKLIEILETFPQDMEVVTRVGHNSGAKIMCSIGKWNSKPNRNSYRTIDAPLLLAEIPGGTWFGSDTKEVLVIN